MKRGCDLLIFRIKIKRSQRAAAPTGGTYSNCGSEPARDGVGGLTTAQSVGTILSSTRFTAISATMTICAMPCRVLRCEPSTEAAWLCSITVAEPSVSQASASKDSVSASGLASEQAKRC